MPEISAKTWNRFVTTNMHVVAEVMGSIHEFEFEKHRVSIRLPKKEHIERGKGFDDVGHLASFLTETEEPLLYGVAKVDVEVSVPKIVNVPEEALSSPPKQVKYFSEEQRKVVDAVCDDFTGIAKRAFQYWLEIIRWVSDDALIGQPSVSGFESGLSTYLMDASTNHRVWASTQVLTVRCSTELTKEHWLKAAEHLKNGDEIPMHLRFLHDAKASRRNRQYEKAVIEIAMACEIYLRYSVFEYIPVSTPEEIKRYIEEANINKYSSQFFRSLVPESAVSDYKKIAKEISSLMSRRNKYVHMGQMHDADDTLCHRFIHAAEELFKIRLRLKENGN